MRYLKSGIIYSYLSSGNNLLTMFAFCMHRCARNFIQSRSSMNIVYILGEISGPIKILCSELIWSCSNVQVIEFWWKANGFIKIKGLRCRSDTELSWESTFLHLMSVKTLIFPIIISKMTTIDQGQNLCQCSSNHHQPQLSSNIQCPLFSSNDPFSFFQLPTETLNHIALSVCVSLGKCQLTYDSYFLNYALNFRKYIIIISLNCKPSVFSSYTLNWKMKAETMNRIVVYFSVKYDCGRRINKHMRVLSH